MELTEGAGGIDITKTFTVGYAATEEIMEAFIEASKNALPLEQAIVSPIGSTIGVHAGPGACGIGFFVKN